MGATIATMMFFIILVGVCVYLFAHPDAAASLPVLNPERRRMRYRRILLLLPPVLGLAVILGGKVPRPPAALPGTCAEALTPFCADPSWPEPGTTAPGEPARLRPGPLR